MKGNRQYLLMVMDGVGLNDEEKGNAFKMANTPNLDRLIAKYPNTHIATSGMAVGLPEGQMGNSEVGHTNIGAGRIVYQELTRITKEIEDGNFYNNEEFLNAIKNVKKNNSSLHIMGLVSDGGVHSHNSHLYALLELAKRNNVDMSEEELLAAADKWELAHGGLSGRTAQQFVDHILGTAHKS